VNILALIPARGGSKGIPRKNLLMLGGKPLIAYSILQAQESKRITRVIVSTDDDEIAEVARQWGAEVPFMRPAEYAQDLSPDIDVFRHCIEWLRDHEQYTPEMIVHLRPPGPVRRVEHIDEAIGMLIDHPDADALRSVSMATQTPYKMWHFTPEGTMEPVLRLEGVPDSQSIPRQRLPIAYWQNGYVDVVRPRAIMEYQSMWGRRVIPYLVEDDLFEIDYPEHIPAVEAALMRLKNNPPDAFSPREGRYPV
jgi:N-acylneuraminate cytidylyltransferase